MNDGTLKSQLLEEGNKNMGEEPAPDSLKEIISKRSSMEFTNQTSSMQMQ